MSSDYSHGILYSPSSLQPRERILPEELRARGITYIRLQWLDLVNTLRERVIPISSFLKMLGTSRPGITMVAAWAGLIYLNLAEGFDAVGENFYAVDLSTLIVCPYEKYHACVMGWFQEKTPVKGVLASEICPRMALKRVVDDAKNRAKIEFLVGFETEFILLKSTDPIVPVNIHSWTAGEALRTGSVEARVMREIVDSLQNSGVEIDMYHAEAAPGQYEIVASPLPPLQAADTLVYTRETIRHIAAKHGLHATFAPRLYSNSSGSSAHAHISIHSTNDNAPPKPHNAMATMESSFLSGVLDHIPAITAISLPIPASYKRVLDGVWSGGTYISWGTESREAPVRLTNAASPHSRRFEMRFIDGTCHPHLALAAITGAGSRAVESQAPLRVKDCGVTPAAMLSEKEREDLGVTRRMSLTWEESRDSFAKDPVMQDIFGQNFVKKFLSANKTLAESLAQDKEERAEVKRLVEYY
ncbi:glutamine synthetase guanido kinase [Moniliophthora roreri MCA 2997]|uniref:Glutamine synthetase guanido kinase n=1 Tax=Moniliophthora roreri (strain MCA 2997) TaxID=1381753 RepID=V2YIU9_MONRO|nr:glutamine synthetase guanido kinase [Moniliophthora roreri MCA 2997]